MTNSILKYGDDCFSLVILDVLGKTSLHSKSDILAKEEYYFELYNPTLNINTKANSSLGFKHSEESKNLIAEFRKGKPLSDKTKKKLSELFSGELNPFSSKKHSSDCLDKMSKSKLGKLNPMYGKPKSKKFTKQMYKDKTGANNPMSKKVYVYDANTKQLIQCYDSLASVVEDLRIFKVTINKYIDTNVEYKSKLFFSKLQ